MSCDLFIHEELKTIGECYCSFCDKVIDEREVKEELCCDEKKTVVDNGRVVCVICGVVDRYEYVKEYVDFYDNMYRIRRKSKYHRKYHVEGVINNLCREKGIQICTKNRDKIFKIFEGVGKVLPLLGKNRKRMISIKFVIKRILLMLDLPYEFIVLKNSTKTLEFYEQCWVEILFEIFGKVMRIIRR